MNQVEPTCEYKLTNTKIGKVPHPYKPKRVPVCKIFCKGKRKKYSKKSK